MERVRRIVRRGIIDVLPFYSLILRRRGLAICVFLTILFLLYSGPSMFRYIRRRAPFIMDSSLNSMLVHVEEFSGDVKRLDAQIHRSFEPDDPPLALFVGNGYIGFDETADRLLLYNEATKTLSVPLPFSSVVHVNFHDKSNNVAGFTQEKRRSGHVMKVVHFMRGEIVKINTQRLTSMNQPVVSVEQHFFSHRDRSSLFVQSLTVKGGTGSGQELTAHLKQKLNGEAVAGVHIQSIGVFNGIKYIQLSGKTAVGQSAIVYSVIAPKVESEILVDGLKGKTLDLVTVVQYAKPAPPDVASESNKVSELVKQDFERYIKLEMGIVKDEHTAAWLQISSNDKDLPALGSHCYKGHHTLNARTLWPTLAELGRASLLERTVHLWLLTLSKRGCGELVFRGGPLGAMQAMLMSFGAFFFHEGHLEFSTPPADLHRDFHYRRLMLFTGDSWLNVSVTVNTANKAVLAVSAESKQQVYACDGGCLDAPVPVSNVVKPVEFPVQQTDPPTAVLYVARSQRHLAELKQTLHVHEVNEAPAHEGHVIALHKHGHHLGGLPALFWATFAFLLVVFHLFLARLIYNEYFAKGQYSPVDNKKYVA